MDIDVARKVAGASGRWSYPPVLFTNVGSDSQTHTLLAGRLPNFEDVNGWKWAAVRLDGELPYTALEDAIRADLQAPDEEANWRGVASVILWGNSGSGYAYARANRIAPNGSGKEFQKDLSDARTAAEAGAFDRAITAAGRLPGLGGTAFASKLVTFLDPMRAGVFDKRILEFLAQIALGRGDPLIRDWLSPIAAWAWTAHGFFQTKAETRRIAEGYLRWCEFLQSAARELDATPTPPPNGTPKWRAVDVERAIFQLANERPAAHR